MRKRFGWLMLMALLCLALLPAAVYAEGGDPAEPAVWDAIGQLEDERLPQDAAEDDYAALAPEVEALVTARADYVEGSARYEDGCLFWELTDGWAYAYFPSVRALNRNMPAEKAESSRAEKDAESEKDGGALMGGGGFSDDGIARGAAFLSPYYGIEEMFTLTWLPRIRRIAEVTGGDYEDARGTEASLPALADALHTFSVVAWDGHGVPGCYFAVNNDDGLDECLGSWDAYGHDVHVVSSGNGTGAFDGAAVARYMENRGWTAKNNLLLLGICLGMENQAIEGPLHDIGVAVVAGWSRSVTGVTSDQFGEAFLDGLLSGKTVAQASQYMRKRIADISDLDLAGCSVVYWDYRSNTKSDSADSESEARKLNKAFFIITSSVDPFPADTQAKQPVYSTWKLPAKKAGGKDPIEMAIPVGTSISRFFGSAISDTFYGAFARSPEFGSLPTGTYLAVRPGVEIRFSEFGMPQYVTVYYPCLMGTCSQTGYWETTLEVGVGDTYETRDVRILVYPRATDVTDLQTEQDVELAAGDQTTRTLQTYKADVYDAYLLKGNEPEGISVYTDGKNVILSGSAASAGFWWAKYRVILWDGTALDHTVRYTVTGEETDLTESISLKSGASVNRLLSLGKPGSLRSCEFVSGTLPAGLGIDCSRSTMPRLTGTCTAPGDYTAALRFITGDGGVINYTLNCRVYTVGEEYDRIVLDIAGGSCLLNGDELTAVWNSLRYAVKSGQIKEGSEEALFDLDRNGTADILIEPEGDYYRVSRTNGFSLKGDSHDNYMLTLSDGTLSRLDADGIEQYYRIVVLHLVDYFDLWIDGTQVSTKNRRDILNDGAFSFDGLSILSVRSSYTGSGTAPIIENRMEGLTVSVDTDCTLRSGGAEAIRTYAYMTLTGSGQLLISSEKDGIVCVGGSLLAIRDADMLIQAKKKGITTESDSIAVHARVIHSDVSIRSGEGAMGGFWSIELKKCMPEDPLNHTVGTDDSNRACLMDTEKNPLKNAEIQSYNEKYALTIDGVPVTDVNREDVLGNGVFCFDGKDALSVNGSYEGTKTIIESAVEGLTITAAEDVVLQTGAVSCVQLSDTTSICGGPLTLISTSLLGRGIDLEQPLPVEGDPEPADPVLFIHDTDLTVKGRWGIDAVSAGSKSELRFLNASVHAEGTYSGIRYSGKISLMGERLMGGAYIAGGKTDIYNSEGVAKVVNIEVFREYALMIDGMPVNDDTKGDILGDGKFSYDYETNTLTVKGDYATAMVNAIENRVPYLTIVIAEDCVLGEDPATGMGTPLLLSADTTITGPGKLTLHGVSWDATIRTAYGAHVTLRDLELVAEGSDLSIQGSGGCRLTIDGCTVTAATTGANVALGGFDSIDLVNCEVVSEGGLYAPFVRIAPNRAWHVDKDKKTVTTTDAVTAASPVLVAAYDADGRFIGLNFVASAGETSLPDAAGVVLFWVDSETLAPKCGAEVVKP